jgi:hypothetical protein
VKGFCCYDTFIAAELHRDAWGMLQLDGKLLPQLFASLDSEIDNARQMFATAAK